MSRNKYGFGRFIWQVFWIIATGGLYGLYLVLKALWKVGR